MEETYTRVPATKVHPEHLRDKFGGIYEPINSYEFKSPQPTYPRPLEPKKRLSDLIRENAPAGGYNTVTEYIKDVHKHAIQMLERDGIDPYGDEGSQIRREFENKALADFQKYQNPTTTKDFIKMDDGRYVNIRTGAAIGGSSDGRIDPKDIEEAAFLGIEMPQNYTPIGLKYEIGKRRKEYETTKTLQPTYSTPVYDQEGNVTGFAGNRPDETGEIPIRPVAGGKIRTKAPQPAPRDVQESINSGFVALKNLDVMEKALSETGRIEGVKSKAGAWLGTNKKAVNFETARNNYKLHAQSLIKGTPSNFDVQTVIDTIPALTSPEFVNASRIAMSRDILKEVLHNSISYYKGTGVIIPKHIIAQAKVYGVNVDSVTPYDVNSEEDPLMRGKLVDLLSKAKAEIEGDQAVSGAGQGVTVPGPAGAQVEDPQRIPEGMKLQRNKKTGEYRLVPK